MKKMKLLDTYDFLDKRFTNFYRSQKEFLEKLQLQIVLGNIKNPYLIRVKNELLVSDLIRSVLDKYLSPFQEYFLDELLKEFAIFICEKVYKGRKSSTTGIDLEFDKEGVRYIVSIKSGPSWGNSQAVNKMISNFNAARKSLRTSNSKINVVAVNGCCYGRDNKPYKEKGDYFKYCGQQFWEFISGNENLYTEIIEPLGHKAKERNEEFMIAYAQIINKFTLSFMKEFCIDGKVDWEKLVKFNSGKKQIKEVKQNKKEKTID
jgi:hypothetical protein